MNASSTTHRRGFLGRVFGAAAAAGFSIGRTEPAFAQASGPDDWIKEVKGTHRTLFDFPQHKNFFPQLHILNYINTYTQAYKAAAGTVGTVGTFYGIGNQASISLGFNDAMWAKYGLGEYLGLKDASGKFYTRNVFNKATKDDAHLVYPGAAGAGDSGIRGFHAADEHREPAEDGNEVHSVQQRARGVVSGAGGPPQGEDGRDPRGPEGQHAARRHDRARHGHRDREGPGRRHQVQPSMIMKSITFASAAVVLCAPLVAFAQQPSTTAPADCRGRADSAGGPARRRDRRHLRRATGARKVLRQGTNFLECQPRMADGFSRCYSKTLGSRRDLEAKLRAEKKSDEDIQSAVAAAVKAGTLPAPSKGMMSYRGYDKRDRIQHLWVMSLPNATPESVGVSTVSQRDAALEGKGLPWMMLPGTPGAHIMIPINPPAKQSTITDQAADEIAQATLPLPEDLRAGRHRLQVRPEDRRAHRRCAKGRTSRSACRAAPTGSPGATTRSAARAAISARSCAPRGRPTRRSRRP